MFSLNSKQPSLNMNLSISWSISYKIMMSVMVPMFANHPYSPGVCSVSHLLLHVCFFPTNLEAICLLILYFREVTP